MPRTAPRSRAPVEELTRCRPSWWSRFPRGGEPRAHARKRALICAFTDLVDTDISAPAIAYLSSLRPQHLPLVVTTIDEELEAMAAAAPERPLEAYEKAIASRTLEERSAALAHLRARGVWVCDARPEDLTAAVVSSYLAIKRRGLL